MSDKIYLFDTTLRDGQQTTGVNFTVSDNIAIEKGGDYLDLHSDFDFVNISYDQSRNMLELWGKVGGN